MLLMVLSFFRVLGGGVNEIGLLQECEPSEWPVPRAHQQLERNEGSKMLWGDTRDATLWCYAICQDTETRVVREQSSCRETLVLPEDGGIMHSTSPTLLWPFAGTETKWWLVLISTICHVTFKPYQFTFKPYQSIKVNNCYKMTCLSAAQIKTKVQDIKQPHLKIYLVAVHQ